VTLKAMAQACRDACGAADVLVLLDARMEEVYWAQYRYQDGWQTVSEPALSAPPVIAAAGPVVACGNGLIAYALAFDALPFSRDAQRGIMPHAAQIAQLAQIELAAGRAVHARDAQPIYLRNKVALTTIERQAKVAV
jgi:tRNA threonylcarbamoyladenosine biosynthesis protein TsaB